MRRRTTAPTAPRWLVPLVVAVLVAALAAGTRAFTGGDTYHVELHHAAQLRPGDAVRVAGLPVGKVESVESAGDRVRVEVAIDDEDAGLTEDTQAEVKLLSLLGQRYLDLQPGDGRALEGGDTIAVANAADSYTMERFWTDAPRNVGQLDQRTLEEAIDVLGTDLAAEPDDVQAALDGLTAVSQVVTRREEQIGRLLESTRAVTNLVVDQKDQLTELMRDADQVMSMVHARREAIRVLLRDARTLVVQLTAIARENTAPAQRSLRRLEQVMDVLVSQRDQLDEVLEMAGPTMRYFTNVVGDGPWMGVNSPFAIIPDDLICVLTPGKCR